jgi:hypothetical protein
MRIFTADSQAGIASLVKCCFIQRVPKPRTKKPRKVRGMSVAELKSQDFAAMKPEQLGESLRKSVAQPKAGK